MKFPEPAVSDGGWPSETYLSTCPPQVQNELRAFYAILQGFFSADHRPDGTHNRVRAVSVTTDEGIQEFGRSQTLGVAEDIQWAPSLFTASGTMTWPVIATQMKGVKAARVGNMLWYGGQIYGCNVGGVAGPELRLGLPFRLKDDGIDALGILLYSDAGAAQAYGVCLAPTGAAYLSFQKTSGANWTITAANDTVLTFSIWLPVKDNPLV